MYNRVYIIVLRSWSCNDMVCLGFVSTLGIRRMHVSQFMMLDHCRIACVSFILPDHYDPECGMWISWSTCCYINTI
ncbi:hypothetical protein BDV29DRAFT_174224 [Aspergillus leporis]|jgi:hypothetical protein|uniref:Uncharacterized protein n=1 Tax=Aspergillus leporis TaxID=41062 RepID=A0A5N5X3P1_9EURO|nr:hypothetical protein BDV29DRAFT_174224 [Aspergillus leporis]